MTKAAGKHSFGFCDRSGLRFPIRDLVPQVENQRPNGLMVGKTEVDIDHPQWRIGEVKTAEDVSLENPRPDLSEVESRGLTAWNPVGGGVTQLGSFTVGLDITAGVGRVTVSDS